MKEADSMGLSTGQSQEKVYKTPEEQIEILRNDRNLDINDEDKAISLLNRTNYYNLINGYKKPFIDEKITNARKEDYYREGVSLNDLYTLYKFDKKISGIFFPEILKIESEIKTILSNIISSKKENAHRENVYLDLSFFNNDPSFLEKNRDKIIKLTDDLKKYIYSDHPQPYIKHYREKHKYVPLWVLSNAMSFGEMTMFYRFLSNRDKHLVVRRLEKHTRINPDNFYYILQMMRVYRNKLAHDEVFYSFKAINKRGYRYKVKFNNFNNLGEVKTSFLTLIIAIKLLNFEEEYEEVREDFLKQLKKLKNNIDEKAFKYVLKQMGFQDKQDEKNKELNIMTYEQVLNFI